jgi:hypothetical protein
MFRPLPQPAQNKSRKRVAGQQIGAQAADRNDARGFCPNDVNAP